MKKDIKIIADMIRNFTENDSLIKIENFKTEQYTCGIYAYKTDRGLHIETTVSTGTPYFKDLENFTDMYTNHTLHEYLSKKVYDDKNITLEKRISDLLNKTIRQFEILRPIHIEDFKKHFNDKNNNDISIL